MHIEFISHLDNVQWKVWLWLLSLGETIYSIHQRFCGPSEIYKYSSCDPDILFHLHHLHSCSPHTYKTRYSTNAKHHSCHLQNGLLDDHDQQGCYYSKGRSTSKGAFKFCSPRTSQARLYGHFLLCLLHCCILSPGSQRHNVGRCSTKTSSAIDAFDLRLHEVRVSPRYIQTNKPSSPRILATILEHVFLFREKGHTIWVTVYASNYL